MAGRYQVVVARDALDALALCTRSMSSGPARVILPGGLHLARSLDLKLGRAYAGMAELMHKQFRFCAVPWTRDGRTYQLVLAASEVGASAILDRFRPQAKICALALTYDRLHLDLPALGATDTVEAFWEIRDLLTDGPCQAMEDLAEQVHHFGASFSGLSFYHRRTVKAPEVKARWEALRDQLSLHVQPKLIAL
jgi:hypothetical protein